jgi:hypothetical protein
MESEYVIQEGLGDLGGCVRVQQGNKVAVLVEFVNDHENAISIARTWKTFNEVHRDDLPCRHWY